MRGLTKEEAIATVSAIELQIEMLSDLMMQTESVLNAIDALESAKDKIKSIYKVNK